MAAFKDRWRGMTAATSSIALLITIIVAVPAAGQDSFPTRPIKLIVPFAAGGAYDVTARLIGEEMSKTLGSAIVIENRPGAGGNIGAQAAVAAQPDGYTLLLGGSPMITSALTSTDIGYDMFKDLTPVCGAMTLDSVMVTSKTTGIDSIKALKEKIASGAWVTYGTQGIYTPGHFMAAWFAHVAGGKAEAVHYKGGSAYTTDLLSGALTYVAATLPVYLGQKDRLNVLATLSQKRLSQIPDAPTMTDAGMPEYMAVDWRLWAAIYAPAKTPTAVVDRLFAACNAAIGTEKLKAAFGTYAMEPLLDYTPERFNAYQTEQYGEWKALVDRLDLVR
jgi:tripartite-type tricarboxylate transporter receptor subunit TctC